MGSSRIAQGDQLGALWPPRGVGWGGWEGGDALRRDLLGNWSNWVTYSLSTIMWERKCAVFAGKLKTKLKNWDCILTFHDSGQLAYIIYLMVLEAKRWVFFGQSVKWHWLYMVLAPVYEVSLFSFVHLRNLWAPPTSRHCARRWWCRGRETGNSSHRSYILVEDMW